MNPQKIQIPVVGKIQIVILADGRIECSVELPGGRPQFNMMMETAKQDMLAWFAKQEDGLRVQAAPPGMRVQ